MLLQSFILTGYFIKLSLIRKILPRYISLLHNTLIRVEFQFKSDVSNPLFKGISLRGFKRHLIYPTTKECAVAGESRYQISLFPKISHWEWRSVYGLFVSTISYIEGYTIYYGLTLKETIGWTKIILFQILKTNLIAKHYEFHVHASISGSKFSALSKIKSRYCIRHLQN